MEKLVRVQIAVLLGCSLIFMMALVASAEVNGQGSSGTVPAAPSEPQIDLGTGQVSWHDNSLDEDGFRVSVSPGDDPAETYTVGPGVTTVTISPALLRSAADSLRVTVVAFNAAGDSPPALLARVLEHGLVIPAATATRVAAQLPGTGTGRGTEFVLPRTGAFALVVGLSLSAFAVASALRRKNGS